MTALSSRALKFRTVMAGLVPAIHVFSRGDQDVDARDQPGHDEFVDTPNHYMTAYAIALGPQGSWLMGVRISTEYKING
jgi:hypothetical protein